MNKRSIKDNYRTPLKRYLNRLSQIISFSSIILSFNFHTSFTRNVLWHLSLHPLTSFRHDPLNTLRLFFKEKQLLSSLLHGHPPYVRKKDPYFFYYSILMWINFPTILHTHDPVTYYAPLRLISGGLFTQKIVTSNRCKTSTPCTFSSLYECPRHPRHGATLSTQSSRRCPFRQLLYLDSNPLSNSIFLICQSPS